MDGFGNHILSDQDPNNFILSTEAWGKMSLQSMGQYVDNVSMFGADLSDDEQAAKYRKSFVEYPLETLSKAQC
jgi:hypothetical protein